jgi:hypothetical protein
VTQHQLHTCWGTGSRPDLCHMRHSEIALQGPPSDISPERRYGVGALIAVDLIPRAQTTSLCLLDRQPRPTPCRHFDNNEDNAIYRCTDIMCIVSPYQDARALLRVGGDPAHLRDVPPCILTLILIASCVMRIRILLVASFRDAGPGCP